MKEIIEKFPLWFMNFSLGLLSLVVTIVMFELLFGKSLHIANMEIHIGIPAGQWQDADKDPNKFDIKNCEYRLLFKDHEHEVAALNSSLSGEEELLFDFAFHGDKPSYAFVKSIEKKSVTPGENGTFGAKVGSYASTLQKRCQ